MHYTLHIRGKVQGVFFRYYTKKTADKLGISGIVKNLGDGSVLIEAVGEEEAMLKFIDWCHQGSPAAIVEEVLVNPQEEPGYYQEFTIER